MLLIYILVTAGIAYCWALEYLRLHWMLLEPAPKTVELPDGCPISIIIVVRNEAANLPHLFKALAAQSLPAKYFELHLIDDASEDDGYALAEKLSNEVKFPVHLHRLRMEGTGGSPKKAAISQVLPRAQGHIIAVTDGDCQPGTLWLEKLLYLWQQRAPVFVSGPVRYRNGTNFFEKAQVLDFAALIGVGAAMLRAGMPGMCNAANMAFSKEAFLKVGGYSGNIQVPSGDDEFLLQKLASYYPEKIHFLKETGAIVSTLGCPDWQSFLHQRIRWAGKWRLHRRWSSRLMPIALFLFYLLMVVALCMSLFTPMLIPFIIMIWTVKAFADFRFLKPILEFLNISLSLKLFLLMELIYPFYVLFFAVASQKGSFRWKGRSYCYSTNVHE